MTDVVFVRKNGWFPVVVRVAGELRLRFAAGADASHDPRTFTVPIEEDHLDVIRNDLARHLLLWSALIPLGETAGTLATIDERAAVALLNGILLSSASEVEALFRIIPWDKNQLITYGADINLLERGHVVAAMRTATAEADWPRAQEYIAQSRRAVAGVVLTPLDTAVLKYTGQYLHGATVPQRRPEAVGSELLQEVLKVVATAETATAGLRISRDPRHGKAATDKQDWARMAEAVGAALHQAYPELADEAIGSVAFLMSSEAAYRAKLAPIETGERSEDSVGGQQAPQRIKARPLLISDEKGAEQKWHPRGHGTATAAFWDFVARHSADDCNMFALEDEKNGEGIHAHFYADSIERFTVVNKSKGSSAPEFKEEYALVGGLSDYRKIVKAFVDGGYGALDSHGPWIADLVEFERYRERQNNLEATPMVPEITESSDDSVTQICKMWAENGYVDPTDTFYVFFDSMTLEETEPDRTQLFHLVNEMGLEVATTPTEAANGEVWVRRDSRIDAELENWA